MDDEIIFGCDPGLSGAGAFVNAAGDLLDVFDLPVAGLGKAARVDAANLAELIRAIAPTRAIVEHVGARPGQGVSSMFRFGQATGVIAGVLGAMLVPVEWVAPARWKKAMRLDAEKETSRLRALETWPAHAKDFARKKDHGKAEAALLALYALRNGGAG
jgi:crossover junction endodeoxyribonuclease RuvC